MKKTILLFVGLFLIMTLHAQGDGEAVPLPLTWQYELESDLRPIELPPIDFTQIREEDKLNDLDKTLPWRYGVQQDISVDLKSQGEFTELANGDRLWRLAFTSADALNLSINFNTFYLPQGTSLQLFNEETMDASRVYTSDDSRLSDAVGLWFIQGDEIWMEYYEPSWVSDDFDIKISSVIHGYRLGAVTQFMGNQRGLNDSGGCNYDVMCSVGADFDALKEEVKKSVALLNLGNGYLCSAVLLNNAAADKTPYLLTANHCLENSDPNLWSARFNWVSPVPECATGNPSTDLQNNFTLSGAIARASNPLSDFALVEMTTAIPESWDVAFAGWNNTDDDPAFEVGIHHPNGDIMKVCRDNSGAVKENAQGKEVWLIGGLSEGSGNGWELGTTESGSSGSPLFDQDGFVIGQLYAGLSFCDGTSNNDEYDVYGRFGVSWDAGSTVDSRLKEWLDPLGTGVEKMGTLSNILSTQEFEFTGDLSIYPNPAATEVTVFNSKYPNLSYLLYDATGKTLLSGMLRATMNTIQVGGFAEGVYFLSLTDEDSGNAIVKRIVVQH